MQVAEALAEDARLHRVGDIWAIGERYDALDGLRIPFLDPDRLGLAFYFWDCWIDARNHDWRYHEPVRCEDWPVLADHVVEALLNESEISHPLLLNLV
jgi:hypothetical protein